MNREAIITGALRELSVIAVGETASAEDQAACVEALDVILEELSSIGYLWSQERQADVAYLAGSTVDLSSYGKVHTVKLLDGAKETPLSMHTERSWIFISDKTETGTPLQIYIEPQGIGNFYPVPDANGTIRIYYNRVIPPSAAAAVPEIPVGWGRALQLGVAVELMGSYGLPMPDRIDLERRWREKKEKMMSIDVPMGPTHIEVE